MQAYQGRSSGIWKPIKGTKAHLGYGHPPETSVRETHLKDPCRRQMSISQSDIHINGYPRSTASQLDIPGGGYKKIRDRNAL